MVKDKNIVLFMFLLLFVTILVPTVSAIEWDNYYVYDEQTNTAIIRNGLTFGSTIAEVTRITPQNYMVAPGYNYVLELSIIGNVDYQDFVTSLDFHDKKNAMAHFNRDYDLKKYDGIEEYQKDTYGCLEEYDYGNGTVTCTDYGINGSVTADREVWTKLTPADMKKDEQLIIRVYTEVKPLESVEWYMDLMGSGKDTGHGTKGIKEWADWTSALNVSLSHYYAYEDVSTTISLDSIGTSPITGLESNVGPGIIGNMKNFDGTSNTQTGENNETFAIDGDWSMCAWVNSTSDANPRVFTIMSGTGDLQIRKDASGKFNLAAYCSLTSTTSIDDGNMHHVCISVNGGSPLTKLYVDGVNEDNSSTACDGGDKIGPAIWSFAGFPGQAASLQWMGGMDEQAFWGREITIAEVIYMYDGGSGSSINSGGGPVDNPPTAELITPANDTTLNTNSILQDFTCKGIDDSKLDNLTFYLWNITSGSLITTDTNTDGQNNTNEVFSYTITGGTNYSWNCLAMDNSSQSAFATNNWTINVLSIPDEAPVVTLNSPPNNTVFTSSPISLQFNCSAYDDSKLDNVSLIINGAINVTNSSGVNDTNYLFSTSAFNDGIYTWTCRGTDNSSQQTTPTARMFTVDGNPPEVTITAPTNGSVVTQFNQSIQLNWTATDATLDSCWYVLGYDNNETCYQESANTTNQSGKDGSCDQVYNGNYSFSGSPTNPSNSYDGNFSTFSTLSGDTYYVNYTKPPKAIFGTKILNRITDGLTINQTVPMNCFYNYADKVEFRMLQIAGKVFLDCKADAEPSGWQNIRVRNGNTIYEEAIIWDISLKNSVTCADNTTVLNYPTSNPDSLNIFFYANDSIGNIESDNVTLLKSTDAPDITITSPVSNYATLIGGQVIDLNFTISNVTVLDDCFYNYNGINNSLNCVTGGNGITNFSYVGGINTLTVFANDTLNNINSSSVTWTVEAVEINYTFVSPVVEGSSTTIDLYTIVNGTINSANLFYNGTGYPANIIEQGGGVTKVTSTFQVPDFPVDTNATFLMSLGLVSSSTANFTTQTQLVQTLEIGNCTAFSFLILNLSLFDEKTLLPLLGTIEADIIILDNTATVELDQVSTAFYNTSNALVCSNIALNSSGNLYSLELRYFVDPTNTSTFLYVPEFYHIQQGETDSLPQTINLYNLNVNQSTEFSILYRDNNYISRPNVLLQIERKYVSEGIFRTVEIPITSSEGSTTGHFDLNNYKYKITATQFGEVLNVFDNPAIICESELAGQCTLSLNGKGNPNPYNSINEVNGIAYVTTINGSQVTVTYTIPSGETQTVRVVMQQDSAFAATTTICNQTLTSSSGSITCTVDETIGDSQVLIEVSSGGYLDRAVAFFEESISDDYNLNQYIIGAFLLMILVTMFVSSPKIMVSVSVFGVALLGLLFLLNGSSIGIVVGVISWLIIAGIIILVKISKKDET